MKLISDFVISEPYGITIKSKHMGCFHCICIYIYILNYKIIVIVIKVKIKILLRRKTFTWSAPLHVFNHYTLQIQWAAVRHSLLFEGIMLDIIKHFFKKYNVLYFNSLNNTFYWNMCLTNTIFFIYLQWSHVLTVHGFNSSQPNLKKLSLENVTIYYIFQSSSEHMTFVVSETTKKSYLGFPGRP